MIIKVVVRQGSDSVVEEGGVIKVHTTEKRKNNRANLDVVRQLSKHFSVPASSVRIIAGATSTKKIIEILKEG